MVGSTQKSCIVYVRACVEQNYPPHCGQTPVVLTAFPIEMLEDRRYTACVVPRNEPSYLGTEMVEDGAAGRVLDDEIEQLHRRICVCTCAQKIAKLFFSVRSMQLLSKLNTLFKNKYTVGTALKRKNPQSAIVLISK